MLVSRNWGVVRTRWLVSLTCECWCFSAEQIVELCGNPDYQDILVPYYQRAHALIVLFDMAPLKQQLLSRPFFSSFDMADEYKVAFNAFHPPSHEDIPHLRLLVGCRVSYSTVPLVRHAYVSMHPLIDRVTRRRVVYSHVYLFVCCDVCCDYYVCNCVCV